MPVRNPINASSPARIFGQVPPSVRLRLGPPRPPTGGPLEGVLSYATYTTPRSGREVHVSQDAQGAFWLFEGAIGEVRLSNQIGLIEAWPSPQVRPRQFMEALFFEWLPAIYTFSGWCVLRASSIWRIGSSSAIAFAGERCCGKSTLARSIGSRPGWGQLADDTLTFEMLGPYPQLLPMPDRVRLSPPATDRLDFDPDGPNDLEWPATPPKLEAIYLLRESSAVASRAEIEPVGLHEAWKELLEPASRLTIPDAEVLASVSDALKELVGSVRVFRLTYSKNIAQLRSLTNGVAQHALDIIHQADTLRSRAATPHLRVVPRQASDHVV